MENTLRKLRHSWEVSSHSSELTLKNVQNCDKMGYFRGPDIPRYVNNYHCGKGVEAAFGTSIEGVG